MDIDRKLGSPAASEDRATGFSEGDGPGPARAAVLETVTPGKRIGPYTVVELLGEGSMGQVYRAHDKRLDRHVAIKLLRLAVGANLAAPDRFEREARAASALNHPNICTIYDVGDFEGRSFIVMELLEGQSLKERIGGRPVHPPEFFDIAQQVCAALRAAHSKGIVHRDKGFQEPKAQSPERAGLSEQILTDPSETGAAAVPRADA